MNKEIDIIIKVKDHQLNWSFDGGKSWRKSNIWNELPVVIRLTINRFIVDEILFPNLKPSIKQDCGALCNSCRNKGKIGFMAFKGYETGTEKVTKVWYDEDAEVSEDVSYGVRYRIEKCDRCGHEESDYG